MTSLTGAERAHSQNFLKMPDSPLIVASTEVVVVASTTCPTLAASVADQLVANLDSSKTTERSATSRIGSVRDHCLQFLAADHQCAMGAD